MVATGIRVFLILLFALAALAQTQTQAPPPIQIQRTTAPIDLDGAVDDAAWQNAAMVDQFYETSPGDNIPAKVKTVAWFTYDDRYFYIGIRADDPEPRRIRAPFVDRDGVIGTDDNIAIFLDTRNDKRSAIELRVNPRGIQADGIFNDANFNEDFSPDFYYDTAAQITGTGWSAEFRIPFTSLRYGSGDPQTWNVLVWRNYPREYRYAFHSAPIPRGANCHICFTHPITGLTGLPEASHLVAAPYVTAQQLATPRGIGDLDEREFDSDAGVDVKWNPSANNAVDLTLNPDFSQIEADVAQITINQRFAVFYPEKRPFFLEGFDLFDTPMQVAYTRTITSPRFGARATGKVGATAYTILATQDRGGGSTIIPGPYGSGFAPQDFKSYATIARVRHDFGSSFVGAVLTDREIDGGGHNRVVGPDFQWRPNDSNSITAQFLYSDTENPDRPDLSPAWNGEASTSHAFRAHWNHQKRTHDWYLGVRDIGENFRADLGFVPQVGYREIDGEFGLRFYYEGGWLRYLRPFVYATQQTDPNDDVSFRQLSIGVNGFGAKNTQFGISHRPGETILIPNEDPDQVREPEQSYTTFFVQFDPTRRIPRITLNARVGDQIEFGQGRVGTGYFFGLGATVRPHDRLDLQFTVNREWLDLDDEGRLYTADVQRVRAQYSFSHRSLVRVIGQYVEDRFLTESSGSFLGSVLYSYKLNWQTVFFAGYGDDRVLYEEDRLRRTGRSLFFKVSYAFIR
jgi:hypothetical protein